MAYTYSMKASDRRKEIAARIDSGELDVTKHGCSRDLADEYGVHPATISRDLRALAKAVEMRKGKPRKSSTPSRNPRARSVASDSLRGARSGPSISGSMCAAAAEADSKAVSALLESILSDKSLTDESKDRIRKAAIQGVTGGDLMALVVYALETNITLRGMGKLSPGDALRSIGKITSKVEAALQLQAEQNTALPSSITIVWDDKTKEAEVVSDEDAPVDTGDALEIA